MINDPFRLREFFHLTLLRHLNYRLSGRSYAVKGGICLRFFHRSPRLSQDMDLDVLSQVRRSTLEGSVDGVLESRPLQNNLRPNGILRLKISKPKQTDTIQRWKVSLELEKGIPLSTKIEFSRRAETIDYSSGIPNAEILREHRCMPFAAQYYDAAGMTVQKISALASPARFALRDLFDLFHLFTVAGVRPEDWKSPLGNDTIEQAMQKSERFEFGDFSNQVLPFLSDELRNTFDEQGFQRLREAVHRNLREAFR